MPLYVYTTHQSPSKITVALERGNQKMKLRFPLTIIYKLKIPPPPVGFDFSFVADEQTGEMFSRLRVCVCVMYVYMHTQTDKHYRRSL
jgi:hypothetical protein